jgi:hypothetical protein
MGHDRRAGGRLVSARESDPMDLLPREARRRLDRFAAAFQGLDSTIYPAFSAASHDPDERLVALARIQEIIGRGPRRAGVLAALADFRDFAVRSAVEAQGGLATLSARTNASSAEERLRFLSSLELAVVAVILWDEIQPDERESLLGPWVQMATRAAAA